MDKICKDGTISNSKNKGEVKIMKYKKTDKICGTYLQGHLNDVCYMQIRSKFGLPHSTGDEWKVSCQWAIEFEDGTIATIYDWKSCKEYCGDDEGIHYKNNESWNIGGNSYDALLNIKEVLNED